MNKNIHNIERIVRVIVGLVIISLVFIGPQSAWGWLGLIPLATGIIGCSDSVHARSRSRFTRTIQGPLLAVRRPGAAKLTAGCCCCPEAVVQEFAVI